MSQRFASIAIVGATGNLGRPIVQALSQAQPPFQKITVLTRSAPSDASILPPGVHVKVVDYSSMESLVPALTGVDALLFAVASAHTRSEIPIIDAAVAAGVRFVIPTEYGLPTTHWTFADVGTFAAKRAVHAQLAALREAGKLDYTLVFVGLWLDITGLAGFVVDAKNKKQELWDDGEHPISLTMTESIAQAVVAVLEGKAAGKTEVRVKNINLSQRRLRELCEEVVGSDGWEITHYDTEERTKVARQKFQAGTADVADHYSFVRRGAGAPGYGSPWKPEEDDSAALGLKEWSEDDVVDFIRKYVNTK